MLAQVCTRVFFFFPPLFCFSLFRSSEWFYTKEEQQEHEALVLKIVLSVAFFLFGIKDVYSETIVFSGINRAE